MRAGLVFSVIVLMATNNIRWLSNPKDGCPPGQVFVKYVENGAQHNSIMTIMATGKYDGYPQDSLTRYGCSPK